MNLSKAVILLFALFIPCLGFSQQTKKVTKEEKYKPKEVYYVLKSDTSVKQGSYKVYDYYNKNLILEGYYKNNLKDSTWTTYKRNKKIVSTGTYQEDQRNGEWSYYNHQGELEQIYNFTKKELVFIKNRENYLNNEIKVLEGADTVLKVVDQSPIYIGGQSSINNYLMKSVNYPREAEKKGISGRVTVYFTIGADGKASNYKVEKPVGYGMDDEALRVVKGLPDTWLPAILNGEKISSIRKLDIVFKIEE